MGRDALMCSCGRQKVEPGNDLCAACRHDLDYENYRRAEEQRLMERQYLQDLERERWGRGS